MVNPVNLCPQPLRIELWLLAQDMGHVWLWRRVHACTIYALLFVHMHLYVIFVFAALLCVYRHMIIM